MKLYVSAAFAAALTVTTAAQAFSLPPDWKPEHITLPSLDMAKAHQCGGHFNKGIPADALEQTYLKLTLLEGIDPGLSPEGILDYQERFDISPAIDEYVASIPQAPFSLCQAYQYVSDQNAAGKHYNAAMAFKKDVPDSEVMRPVFTFVLPISSPS